MKVEATRFTRTRKTSRNCVISYEAVRVLLFERLFWWKSESIIWKVRICMISIVEIFQSVFSLRFRGETCKLSRWTEKGNKVAEESATIWKQKWCHCCVQRIVQAAVPSSMRKARKRRAWGELVLFWSLDTLGFEMLTLFFSDDANAWFWWSRILYMALWRRQDHESFDDSSTSRWISLLRVFPNLAHLFEGFCLVSFCQFAPFHLLLDYIQSGSVLDGLDHRLGSLVPTKSFRWIAGICWLV